MTWEVKRSFLLHILGLTTKYVKRHNHSHSDSNAAANHSQITNKSQCKLISRNICHFREMGAIQNYPKKATKIVTYYSVGSNWNSCVLNCLDWWQMISSLVRQNQTCNVRKGQNEIGSSVSRTFETHLEFLLWCKRGSKQKQRKRTSFLSCVCTIFCKECAKYLCQVENCMN